MSIRSRDLDNSSFTPVSVFKGIRGSVCCYKRPLFRLATVKDSREFEIASLMMGPIFFISLVFYAKYVNGIWDSDDATIFTELGLVGFLCFAHELVLLWCVLVHGRVSEHEINSANKCIDEEQPGDKNLGAGSGYIQTRFTMASYLETLRVLMFTLQFITVALCIYMQLYMAELHGTAFFVLVVLALLECYLFTYTTFNMYELNKSRLLVDSFDMSRLFWKCSAVLFIANLAVLVVCFRSYYV